MNFIKKCHICGKELSRPLESLFSHCFECNSQRLDQMTVDFDPCPICAKNKKKLVRLP